MQNQSGRPEQAGDPRAWSAAAAAAEAVDEEKKSEKQRSLLMKEVDWDGFEKPRNLNKNTGHAVFFTVHPELGRCIVKLNKTDGYASTQEVCGGTLMRLLSPEDADVKPTYLLVDKKGHTIGVVIPLIKKFHDYTEVNLNSVIADVYRGQVAIQPYYINDNEKFEGSDHEKGIILRAYALYEAAMAQYEEQMTTYEEEMKTWATNKALKKREEPKKPITPIKPLEQKAFEKPYSIIKNFELRKQIHAYFSARDRIVKLDDKVRIRTEDEENA